MIGTLITTLALVPGVLTSEYCKEYVDYYHSVIYYEYYCSGRCCGTRTVSKCCSDKTWSVGYAGATVSGIIGFMILVAFIVCIVKACTKRAGHGRVVSPQSRVVYVTSGSGRLGPYGQFTGPQPPPYTAGPAPPYSAFSRKRPSNEGFSPGYPPNGPGPSSGQPTHPPPFHPPPGPIPGLAERPPSGPPPAYSAVSVREPDPGWVVERPPASAPVQMDDLPTSIAPDRVPPVTANTALPTGGSRPC